MKPNREMLQAHLEMHEEQLRELTSYLTELKNTASKLGTDNTQYEEAVMEAESNIKYYGSEVARIKTELGKLEKDAPAAPALAAVDTVLPHTLKQGIGSLLLSSISFAAGMLVGSMLKDRRDK